MKTMYKFFELENGMHLNRWMCLDYIIVLGIVLFSSCNPDMDIKIPEQAISSVQILDQLSHKPVVNARVTLIEKYYAGSYNWSSTDLETQFTDENGLVKFSKIYYGYDHYVYGNNYSYDIRIDETEYYFKTISGSISDNEIIYREPKAWVNLHIKDLNPNDGNEILAIHSYSVVGKDEWHSLTLYYRGQQIDDKILCLAHPNDNAEFKIENYKSNGTIKYSIFSPIKANDTLNLDVFFK